MDGTAAGMLGKLPSFQRQAAIIPHPGKSIPEKQYLIGTPIQREFIDSTSRSSQKNLNESVFDVELEAKLHNRLTELIQLFFDESISIDNELFQASLFIQLCYMNAQSHLKLRLIRRPLDKEIYRAIIDFGRCCISGSIAGGSFRRESSVTACSRIISAAGQFIRCTHTDNPFTACNDCSLLLINTSMNCEQELSSASRLIRAIGESSLTGSSSNLLELTNTMERVLR